LATNPTNNSPLHLQQSQRIQYNSARKWSLWYCTSSLNPESAVVTTEYRVALLSFACLESIMQQHQPKMATQITCIAPSIAPATTAVIALPMLSSPSTSIYLDASAKDSQRLLKAFKLLHPRFQCHVISCRAKRDDPPDPAPTPAPLGEGRQTNKAHDAESPFGMFECVCVSTLKSHSRRLDE
jgi:hypothetical protein